MTSEVRTRMGTQTQRALDSKGYRNKGDLLSVFAQNHFKFWHDPASIFMIKHRKLPPECVVCVKYEELIQGCQT